MAAHERPTVAMRAKAIDAFRAAGPETVPMTHAELDRRLTAALTATMVEMRRKAGLDEGRSSS